MTGMPLESVARARRKAWRDMLMTTTIVLLAQWAIRSILLRTPDVNTTLYGIGALCVAALIQSTLFGDRLFLANEARRTLSTSRRVATMAGHMFHDARHILAIRDRTRASQLGLAVVGIVVIPAWVFVSTRYFPNMPSLVNLAIITLVLGATPGVMRLSVVLSGLSMITASPRGTPLLVEVSLCLIAGLGLLAVTWRQAVSDDEHRFADLQRRPPLSRWSHHVRWALQFLIVGALAAAILPKPKMWSAAKYSPKAGIDEEKQGGSSGKGKNQVKPSEPKRKSDKKDSESNAKAEAKRPEKMREGGSGEGQGQGSSSGDGFGEAQGGAPTVGPRSDGDQNTGETVIKPPSQLERRKPKMDPPILAIVVILVLGFLAYLFLRKSGKRRKPRIDPEEQNPKKVTKREQQMSHQLLMRTLFTAKTEDRRDASTVIRVYNDLLAHMARIGTPKLPGETPDEFAWRWVTSQKTNSDDTRFVTTTFCRAYYGSMNLSAEEFDRFLNASARLGQTPQ